MRDIIDVIEIEINVSKIYIYIYPKIPFKRIYDLDIASLVVPNSSTNHSMH